MRVVTGLSKTERQDTVVEKWITGGKRGLFQACPRFGKTRVGLNAINRCMDPNLKLMILVPSDIIRSHWIKEVKELQYPTEVIELVSNSIVTPTTIINQTKDNKLITPDLIIIDEIHRYFHIGSITIRNILLNLDIKYCLGLTGINIKGSLPQNVIHYFGGIIDIVTEDEALENNWISGYVEYNIPLELSELDKKRYAKFSILIKDTLYAFKGMAKRLNNFLNKDIFKNDLETIFACHAGLKYKKGYMEAYKIRDLVAFSMGWTRDLDPRFDHNQRIIQHWNPDVIYESSKSFKEFLRKRNDLLLHNRVKIEAVLKVLELNPVPTIIFNDSTDMVDEITNAIGDHVVAYHSNIKSRPVFDSRTQDFIRIATGKNKGKIKNFGKVSLKKAAIEGMRIGKFKYLVTAKALDEGLDIPNVEQIITTSGTTNPIQYFQRVSRGKTIDTNNENKLTLIFNFYFDDFYNDKAQLIPSRDKQKLQLRQQFSNDLAIELNSVNQIQYLFT